MNRLSNKIALGLTLLLTVIILLIYTEANVNHFTRYMEADAASSTLQVPLLYENGFRMPDTWCISTENFIICPQNLGAFLYPLTGKNMNLSMGLACSLMMLILIAAIVLYLRKLKMNFLQIAITVLLTLTTASFNGEAHKMLFLYAGYYTVHYIITFIILIAYVSALEENRLSLPLTLFTILLAIIGGMQGMHISLFCLAPLCGTELLRRLFLYIKKDHSANNLITVWIVSLFVIAFGITEFTATYGLNPRRNIRHSLEKFMQTVFPELSRILNFDAHPIWSSLLLLVSVCGYILATVLFIRSRATKSQASSNAEESSLRIPCLRFWGTLPIVMSFFATVFLTTFTTAQTASRYFVMLVFIMSIGYSLCTELLCLRGFQKHMWIVVIPVILYSLIYTEDSYRHFIKDDPTQTKNYYEVASWMIEHDYEYGYSTFEHANTTTVYSNGGVKVRALDNMYDLKGCKWLTDSRWYPPVKSADGITCYIFSEARRDEFERFLSEKNPKIIEHTTIQDFEIYALDRDYSVWE